MSNKKKLEWDSVLARSDSINEPLPLNLAGQVDWSNTNTFTKVYDRNSNVVSVDYANSKATEEKRQAKDEVEHGVDMYRAHKGPGRLTPQKVAMIDAFFNYMFTVLEQENPGEKRSNLANILPQLYKEHKETLENDFDTKYTQMNKNKPNQSFIIPTIKSGLLQERVANIMKQIEGSQEIQFKPIINKKGNYTGVCNAIAGGVLLFTMVCSAAYARGVLGGKTKKIRKKSKRRKTSKGTKGNKTKRRK